MTLKGSLEGDGTSRGFAHVESPFGYTLFASTGTESASVADRVGAMFVSSDEFIGGISLPCLPFSKQESLATSARLCDFRCLIDSRTPYCESSMAVSPPETRASLILRLPDAQDVAAWEELVELYGPLLFRLALRQGLQPADADDLVQEVFTAVARSVSQWLERPDRGKFRAWLARIARNTAVNLLTRRTTQPLAAGGDAAASVLAELAAREAELSQTFELEYRREVFIWAADLVRKSVAETTWQSFYLTHVEGLAIADAAAQLGVSVGTVYVARSRVMSRLQELVTQHEVTE